MAAEVRDLARQYGQVAIQRLVALMHSDKEGVAVRAAEALLDRGYGRPVQGLELNRETPSQCFRVEFVPTRNPGLPAPSRGTHQTNIITQPEERVEIVSTSHRWLV